MALNDNIIFDAAFNFSPITKLVYKVDALGAFFSTLIPPTSVNIYQNKYFEPLMSREISFDALAFYKAFYKQFHQPVNGSKVTMTFTIDDLLESNEIDTVENFSKNKLLKRGNIVVDFDCGVTYTLKQVLLALIYGLIVKISHAHDPASHNTRKAYYKTLGSSGESVESLMAKHNDNVKGINAIIHTFIKKFIKSFQANIALLPHMEQKNSNDKRGSFIFIYSDLIDGGFVGGTISKVLFALVNPHPIANIFTSFGGTKPMKISRNKIDDITIEFRNEYGDVIKFKDSDQPSFVEIMVWPMKR